MLQQRLISFLAVAEDGSFTAGARRLGHTQSAASQAVAALEAELGEALFVRDGRRIALTEAGRVLRDHGRRAADELANARAQLAALRDLTAGTLRLGTTDTLATHLLPPVFAAFRDAYPAVDLVLVNQPTPALAARVAARELDLAVGSLPLPTATIAERRLAERVHAERLAPQRDVVVCPPGHALAGCHRPDLAALAQHPLLLLDRSTTSRALLDARFAAAGLTPRVAMEMTSVEVLLRLVELGFGVAVVPAVAAARVVSDGRVVALELGDLGQDRSVGIITPVAGSPSPAARAFVRLARTRLAARTP